MHAQQTKAFLQKHSWIWIPAVAVLFAFYWYEVRPIMVYRNCAEQSSADARALLKSKAEIAGGTPQGLAYTRLMEQNLYLRTDYESFLMKCLMYHGMQIAPLQNGEDAEGAVDTPVIEE